MDFRKQFVVQPGSKIKLSKMDAVYQDKHLAEARALAETQNYCKQISKQQYLFYSEKKHALLIVLQALDAAGKDGTVNHVMASMNPQGNDGYGVQGTDSGGTGARFSVAHSSPCAGERSRRHFQSLAV